MLEGDAAYLERLVLNLVSNAVKFTPRAAAWTSTSPLRSEVAQLTVKDTGMGIPLEEQGRLFQRFFRSTLATEHAIQGTGLGLHIVRSIAEAHHGSADFESTPGVGTTFWILLPMPGSRRTPTRTGTESTDGEPAELRQLVGVGRQETILRTTTQSATTPATPPATLRMLSVRGCPLGSTKCAFTEAISRRMMVFGLAR